MLTRALFPSDIVHTQSFSWVKDLILIGMASLLIGLSAPISIPLPFTPVPIVLASHICLALGVTLGSRRAGLAVLAYLLQGAMGLPVFALGAGGIAPLLGPTGGYLFGYAAAAYTTGFLLERWKQRKAYQVFAALAVGNGIIFLFGVGQLALFVGVKSALLLGFVPFLFGDALKLLVVYRGMRVFR